MSGSGQIYRIPLVRTAVSAAVDLCEIVTAAGYVAWVHIIELSQSTEVGDAAEEMLQLAWRVGNTTTGSGGNASVAAIPQLPGQPASSTPLPTIETFNTTKATVGTVTTLIWDWNVRMPFEKIFTPETQLFIPPGVRACLELVSAPADPVTIGGIITLEVLG